MCPMNCMMAGGGEGWYDQRDLGNTVYLIPSIL